MNKEVFLRAGGLTHILELFRLIHTHSDWSMSSRYVKVFEIVLLEVLHPLAASFKFRRLLVQQGAVELSLKSLLRFKLERKAVFGEDQITPYLLAKAMTTLCNLCEVHMTHVKIGSNPDALEQLICIAHSSHYDPWHAQVVVNLLVCVAHAREIHHYLASDNVVGGIIDSCEYRSQFSDSVPHVTLLRYYAQLVFSKLILLSSPHLSLESLEKMDKFSTDFLWQTDPVSLSRGEQRSGNFWSVFEPFVALLYVPRAWQEQNCSSARRGLLLRRLQVSSIRTALLALHVIVLGSDDEHNKTMEIMRRENLIPYIIALPSHVPAALQEQAVELVRCLGQCIPIEPPALAELAKASLAKYQFGLGRMLHLHTPHELVEEYYPSPTI
jgi:hypothetical protein